MVVVELVVHDFGSNPEGERATVNQRLVALRPVSDGMKRLAHDADLKRMMVIRSLALKQLHLNHTNLGYNDDSKHSSNIQANLTALSCFGSDQGLPVQKSAIKA